jgi:hypothetical protein
MIRQVVLPSRLSRQTTAGPEEIYVLSKSCFGRSFSVGQVVIRRDSKLFVVPNVFAGHLH